MAQTEAEKQRAYKERKYALGYKQIQLWVKRDSPEQQRKTSKAVFFKKLEKLFSGWEGEDLGNLLNLIISIVEAKKEAREKKETK